MSYILSPALERAIDVAIHLNKPLLLCGEPGTGKTTLAKHLALAYSTTNPFGTAPFHRHPLVFNTKTTSVATDLFYSYDALRRLRDAYAQFNKKPSGGQEEPDKLIGDYIKLNAFGKAIAMTHGADALAKDKRLQTLSDISKNELPTGPMSSVVLIDEIDKAPRDFPNDILNELENHEFEIREMDAKFPPAPDTSKAKIIVLMTSNNEKNLPDAFLRRCVFHYIEFPDDFQLEAIIRTRFDLPPRDDSEDSKKVMGIIKTFNELRKQPLLKKPATAELIDWLSAIKKADLFEIASNPYTEIPPKIKKQLEENLGILLKNNIDIKQAKEIIKTW